MRIRASSLKVFLLRLTFFLGPAGIFFTPISGIGSLRTFYFTTAIINLVFLFRVSRRDISQYAALLLASALLFFSASFSLLGLSDEVPIYINPIVRVLVICNLMFGFFNIYRVVLKSRREDLLEILLADSFKGFFCIFFLGLALYFGYIFGRVSPDLYNRFTTLEQTAYGYSRFSPGTYPNEFGVICSFYAIYAVLMFQRKGKGFAYLPLSIIFMAGVFLTSTRAAYITLVLGYAYIALTSRSLSRRLVLSLLPILFVPLVVISLNAFSFDVVEVIARGYESAVNNTGSSNVRMEDWSAAMDDLMSNLFFGVGFESPKAYSLHNLPLQIVYGLGMLGTAMLVAVAFVFAFLNKKASWSVKFFSKEEWHFMTAVMTEGVGKQSKAAAKLSRADRAVRHETGRP